MFETYEAVFTPLAIKRIFRKDLAATLDQQGKLTIFPTECSATEHELEIPFSFPNLVKLTRHPLVGWENVSVITCNNRVLKQRNHKATKAGIYFMRSNFLQKSLGEEYFKQEARVRKLNQEIVPLIIRSFSHSLKILDTGKCPDETWIYSRTSDWVRIDNYSRSVLIGGFSPGACVSVNYSASVNKDDIGVAPGVPAEA
jgi:hypothetical protein